MIRLFLLIAVLNLACHTGCTFTSSPVEAHKTAAYWSEKQAEKGSVSARKMLGSMYYLGEGVPKDLKKAYAWYKLAAGQGDAGAQKFVDLITVLLSHDELIAAETLFLSKQDDPL